MKKKQPLKKTGKNREEKERKPSRQKGIDIAIIGMACRFPGANHYEEFWENLKQVRSEIQEIPRERWDWKAYWGDPQTGKNKSNCKWGGFIKDIDAFDPGFFNLSAREAEAMDPQQRIMLELSWSCFEDAGICPSQLSGEKIGVFIGVFNFDYKELLEKEVRPVEAHHSTGTATAVITNRISYYFNFKGPSFPLDTACSSSLNAIHSAVQSLRQGECIMALAGGISLLLTPTRHIAFSRSGMLSPTGSCKTFGDDADGYIRGEGAGLVLLKPLQKALEDGNSIYGTLKGSAINHSGKTYTLTYPNPEAQAEVIVEALQRAGITPDTISFVEAHGTGTPKGDPIEFQGLLTAFQRIPSRGGRSPGKNYCGLGSVKTNIGHLESAAGIAGIIKVLLCMKYQQLPGLVHFKQLNHRLSIQDTPFYIVDRLKEWTPLPGESRHVVPRRAGVSSFGFGGTNAHVILEEAPGISGSVRKELDDRKYQLILLSAKTEEALRQKQQDLAAWLDKKGEENHLEDIGATLLLGREHFQVRAALVVESVRELGEKLKEVLEHGTAKGYFTGNHPGTGEDKQARSPIAKPGQAAVKKLYPRPKEKREEYRKKLIALAELYVKGFNPDWKALAAGKKALIPGLPTYPFARERFWIPGIDPGTVSTTSPAFPGSSAAAVTGPAPLLITAAETMSSHPSDKPRGISLQSLSEDRSSPHKSVEQIRQTSPLSQARLPEGREDSNPAPQARAAVPVEILEEELAVSLAEALYMKRSDIDPDKKFIDMGVDSIIGVEWIRAVNQHYGVSIPATRVYDYPNLREFAAFLAIQLQSGQPANLSSPRLSHPQAVPPAPLPSSSASSIAIVGMSGRYPGAKNPDQFWDNLAGGKNFIREIPASRWDVNRYYDPRPAQPGKMYCKWLGLLEDIDYFDPLFFNISPGEAELMDPQQRLFLQEGYRAFEDAGYNCQLLSNRKCGVYLGIMSNEYGLMLAQNRAGGTNPTGNSYAVAAARISYYLNLKGPAIAIDTACSSSLAAAHLACQALSNHEIDMALVGGVTLYLAPESYIGMCGAGMLAADGQCKTFDNRADGFVPGEGVGALVLKRLEDAEADGDSIYGAIIGSGINQDGKTNGITAPSMNSQIELEREIYDKYHIDPGSIGYVEMHGTGTKLGDPVELEALAAVYKERTQRKNYCAIGSVKTNIGHTSAAAGVAGIHKVLLSLRHRKLAPTLNFNQPNEHFDFEDSPFYVNTGLRSWDPVPGTPRRAGVSAFGFSGTNVHLVIEEYQGMGDLLECAPSTPSSTMNLSTAPSDMNSSFPLRAKSQELRVNILFVLSAKSKEQLNHYAQIMKSYMESHRDLNLADMAYTLRVGREPMDYRLAFLADSREGVLRGLEGFIADNPAAGVLTARVKKSKGEVKIFEADEDANALLQTWVQKKKLKKIAELWVKGLDLDWNRLYGDNKPRRLHLPTYPFTGERYWVPVPDREPDCRAGISTAASLHPLLHRNTSDLTMQRFSSTFTGQEFFLADHVVKGQRVLPGVACLEMARAAVEQAAGALEPARTGIRLKNVVWTRPIIVGDRPIQIHTRLFPLDNGEIAFEIYSQSGEFEEEPEVCVHCQGTAVMLAAEDVPRLNLDLLQAGCSQRTLSSSQCYEAFGAMGLDYGPGHRGIEKMLVGPGQVLAKLSLPFSVSGTQDRFVLHPSLMDSALQASLGLMIGSADSIPSGSLESLKPALPFALEELEIHGSCPSAGWALVRAGEGSAAGGQVQKPDIDLCDETGTLCVRMKGFSSRVPEGELQADETPVGTVMLTPVWDAIPAVKGQVFPSPTDQVVIIGGSKKQYSAIRQHYPGARALDIQSRDTIAAIAKKLGTVGSIDHILWIAPRHSLKSLAEDSVIREQRHGVLLCFRVIKALLGLDYGGRDLGWSVITRQAQPIGENDLVNPGQASLHGLMGSLAREYPTWRIWLMDLEADADWPLSEMFRLPPDPQGNVRVYRDRQWYEQRLVPLHYSPPSSGRTLYRRGGVYVVIGGAGGIGEAWSEYMIRAYRAQIVWIGRRRQDAALRTRLEALAALGPAPLYITADATDQEALHRAYEDIKQQFSSIHGVIHSAIVLRDQGLANMEEEQFNAGLAAKVEVSVCIARVFQKEALDFVLFFSSIIAFTKAPGQGNYAAGCTFMDAFARQLSHEWSCAVKTMNWGYWGSVGVVASDAYRERMARTGLGSIEPPEAMEALETLMAGPISQVALIKTTKPTGVEGLNFQPGEGMTIYPEIHPSIIGKIQDPGDRPAQASGGRRLKAVGDPHIQEMDKLLCQLMWGQLQSMGLFKETNTRLTEIRAKTGLVDGYVGWLEESTAILVRQGYLCCDGESYRVMDRPAVDLEAAWKEWDEQKKTWLEDPGLRPRVVLVEAVLRALSEILLGKRPATDILFPGSSLELVAGIYKRDMVSDYFNEVLADMVAAYIRERLQQDSSAAIRILEIGAGTGGTSAMVLQKIRPYREHIEEYCYTDVSRAFLTYGEKEYGPGNPYLTYRLFDMEVPLAGQGIGVGAYDIVIAANVLHAGRNIRHSLRNIKAALRKNGLLILNELSSNRLYLHLTFGLLEGWWRYEDAELRIPGCPALTPGTWQKVLESEGFSPVVFPVSEAHDRGQQIIIAQSDGIIRQQQPTIKSFCGGVRKFHGAVFSKRVPLVVGDKKNTNLPDQILNDYLKEIIIEKLSESLKVEVDKIDVDESFADYGVDSITGVHLVQVINQALMIELETTSLFDYSSVNQLTAYILSKYKDVISAGLGQEGTRGLAPLPEDLSPGSKEKPHDFAYSNPGRFLRTGESAGEEIRNRVDSIPQDSIAIIGMSGRFARSGTVRELWDNLARGIDLVEEVTRWDLSSYYPGPQPGEKSYCHHGSFLGGIDGFDSLFFNISGLEATYMDPQQRFFLEESWQALEDAGYAGSGVQGRLCGIYVGCNGGDYQHLLENNAPAQAFWGTEGSVVPARIAYYLDLQGPAVAVDTACSSSLVALHLACQGLWTGETELALAGGVFIQSTPGFYLRANRAGMLSPTGRCFTFDQRADGFVPGEGVGVLVLKRLNQAVADGDHIYGVIRGSGVNQDGTTNGITAPSANSQERLLRHVYERFRIHPQQITMVEAHGTGTILGDPIEYGALTRAFGAYTDKKEYCAIGSIKTNIGHAATAAGVAGVIKILLSLQHKKIPPSLHFETGNPNIPFKESPFYVNTSLKEWEIEPGARRCAAVSSFGFSGTNAHLVIEEAPQVVRSHPEKPGYVVVLSARTFEQLQQQAEQTADYCEQEPGLDCGNLSYTLLLGRKHLNHRLACVVRSREELARGLRKWLAKGKVPQIYVSELPESDPREQPSLKRYGNRCLRECQAGVNAGEYLEHLTTIADLYIQGYGLEFEGLFSDGGYSRVSLPTYPFSRERYWVPEPKAGVKPEVSDLPGPQLGAGSGEPGGISLRPLSGEPVVSPITVGPTRPSITLAPTGSEGLNRAADIPGAVSVETLQEELQVSLAEALYIKRSDVDLDKKFIDMGVDSIIGVEWIRGINKKYGVSMTATKVYDYPNIRKFAAFLASQLKPGVSSNSSSPVQFPGTVCSQDRGEAGQSFSEKSIAIVGMSGRYPGAANLDQYWDNLVRAENFIREIPVSRWDVNRCYDPCPGEKGKVYCKWMGLLEDVEYFDPLFFNIPPAEAAVMDPQHRLFLQEGYKAFEDAGYSRQRLNGKKCGVYIGLMNNEYGRLVVQSPAGVTNPTSNSAAIAAARLPYFLNLKGPAIPIDTACSSSLAATHLACQALSAYEIDMALAGGVSLYLTPESYIGMCKAGMLSAQGQCRPFDNSADGFVPAEGVGALVLKRLKDARADGDSIYGVIIGSGINHDGRTNGITSPSKSSQVELEREIYHKAGIEPGSIGFIETHGTGTKLGDLIELEALAEVFKERTHQGNVCALGSVKGNIGHTSAAAGVASIHKVLLCMKHKQLVPTLNFRDPNEHFNFEDSPFYVNTESKPWEVGPGNPRRAAVSAFSFSGTNVHLVMEEYLPETGTTATPPVINASHPILFVLSAQSTQQLTRYAESMKSYIEAHEALNLTNMTYTLQLGREAMAYRLAVTADSRESLLKSLEEYINPDSSSPAGVFTGQVKMNEEEVEPETGEAAKAKALLQKMLRERNFKQAAELWVQGMKVDWSQLYSGSQHQPVRLTGLPTYPFARERCWLPVTGESSRDEYEPVPEVYAYDEPYLGDHTIHNERVLIGVTHASLALNTFFKIFPGEDSVHLHQLNFVKPIAVKPGQRVEVLVKPVPKESKLDFTVVYRRTSSGEWSLTAEGSLKKTGWESKKIDIEAVKKTLTAYEPVERIYTGHPGIGLGESFKTITRLYRGKDRVLARVVLSKEAKGDSHDYVLHPLITNSAFLATFPLLESLDGRGAFLPFGIQDLYFRETGRLEQCWVLAGLSKYSGEMMVFDADVIDDESRVLAHYSGCSLKRLRPGSPDISPRRPGGSFVSRVTGEGDRGRFGLESDIESEQASIGSLRRRAPGPPQNFLLGEILKYLIAKLSRLVEDPAIFSNLEANLMDLGLESSQLVALGSEIRRETGIEITPTLFFEYPNLKELTAFFSREHPDVFKRVSGVRSQTVESVPLTPTARAKPSPGSDGDDIAVIGMHGLFADAPDLDRFWEHLREKRDLVKEIPVERWDYRPWYDEDMEAKDKTYCKWGSFIDGADRFDADFFNISPREAEWMDPQLRLLLQSIYAAGEDAGYLGQLRGAGTGVFVGVCCHDYMQRITELNLPVDPYIATGNSQTVIANRVSFFFDFKGPSLAFDTACSSSLFALHSACRALRNSECDMAFVGGANLLLSSWHYRYFCSIGALSPTGRCHSFDEAADGYVPGEAVASILLKPLSRARQDGDHIYAVIKGSAALHGGYTPSFTAPGVAGEENLLVKAWENAGIPPDTISYLETHGTGTKLGDPIEITGLINAFKRFTQKEGFCAIGTVKSNIGHAEGAAGIAGVIKVILQMQHGQIPAMPQFNRLNPYIRLEKSALYINRELEEWKSPGGVPRRAGVSSFGFSGSYAHVVLEEYVPGESEPPQAAVAARVPAVIVLSARNEKQLRERVQQLLATIDTRGFSDTDLADIAYTLQVGREAMEERLALVVESVRELREKLAGFLEAREGIEDIYRGQVKPNKETLALLSADEDMAGILESWISKKEYGKLPGLWVKGLKVDWNKLYDGVTSPKPRRISLPTYPFARQRYWLPELESGASGPTRQPEVEAAPASSGIAAKPAGISLQPLSGERIFPGKPAAQTPPSIPLAPAAASFPSPAPAGRSAELLAQELRISLAEILHLDPGDVETDKQFVYMGLDSISGVEWVRAINKQYKVSIQAARLYDYPTLEEFSRFLEKELNKNGDFLDDLLQKVQQGAIKIEEADERLHRVL